MLCVVIYFQLTQLMMKPRTSLSNKATVVDLPHQNSGYHYILAAEQSLLEKRYYTMMLSLISNLFKKTGKSLII